MSTKKTTKKSVPAKKPAATKKAAPAKKKAVPVKKPVPAKKAAPAKKPVPAKKQVPAKKTAPAKKPVSVKKSISAKKPVSTKKVISAKKPTPAKKPAVPANAPVVTKPVTPSSVAVSEESDSAASSRDFAYSIAEMMKRENRRKEEETVAAEKSVRLSRRPTSRAKGKETLKFPDSDLAEFKKRLLQLRQTATGQSATLKTIALEQTEDRSREDDDGSDAFLRLQSLSQVDSQNKIIFKIDDALRRIADGTYGICEICGKLIRKPRLMNMPFVHTCMECQSEMELPSNGRG